MEPRSFFAAESPRNPSGSWIIRPPPLSPRPPPRRFMGTASHAVLGGVTHRIDVIGNDAPDHLCLLKERNGTETPPHCGHASTPPQQGCRGRASMNAPIRIFGTDRQASAATETDERVPL